MNKIYESSDLKVTRTRVYVASGVLTCLISNYTRPPCSNGIFLTLRYAWS